SEVSGNKLTITKRTDIKNKIILNLSVENILKIGNIMDDISNELYNKAFNKLIENLTYPMSDEEFFGDLENNKLCCINWCNSEVCEISIKQTTGAKTLCIPTNIIPFEQKFCDYCISCGIVSDNMEKVIFGRSY